jgi:hypothetical protein
MGVGCGDGALGDQVVPNCVESIGLGTCWRYLVVTLLLLHRKLELPPFLFFSPLEARPLKAAYSWWRGPIPFLGDRLWVCRVRVQVRQQCRWMVRLRDVSLRSRMPVARRIKRWRPFWEASYRCVEFHWFSQETCNDVLHNGHAINSVLLLMCDAMYDSALLSVRRSVRDSHWSRTIVMVQGFGFSMKIRGFTFWLLKYTEWILDPTCQWR